MKARVKQINGHKLNGTMLFELAKSYI